jgi:ribose 5-phosphate isomerase A
MATEKNLKLEAARQALAYVRSGMVLGLGTGSTNAYFVDLLGEKLQDGGLRDIVGVPTSEGTARRARALGIPISTLAEHPRLDLVVDGADEVDPDLNLIKGLGRAMLREKIVEIHADHFVVVADESKLVAGGRCRWILCLLAWRCTFAGSIPWAAAPSCDLRRTDRRSSRTMAT